MAQYFTDFSEYATGAIPSGWTRPWTTVGSWTVANDAEATGGKKLVHSAASTTSRRALVWTAIDGDPNADDVEIAFKFRHDGAGVGARLMALARSSGDDAEANGYLGGVNASSQAGHTIQKYVAGTASLVGDAEFTLAPNLYCITRFRLSGTSLKVKNWLASDAEPAAWSWEGTDSSITSAGKVGLFNFGAATVYDIDWYGVGTNGDAAPTGTPQSVAVRGARVTLHDREGNLRGAMTGITATWWDDPHQLGAHTYQTASASINASGVLTLDVDAATALSLGDAGHLKLYKAGATAQDDLHFSSRINLVDIA